MNVHVYLYMYESSEGLSSTTNPKPRGNHPSACTGTPRYHQQKGRYLALRTRGGRLKSSFLQWELSLPT